MKYLALSFVVACAASSLLAAEKVKLTTSIPNVEIRGTPVPIDLPNLEPAPQSAPTTEVPEGTMNVAKGKSITASDDFPIIGDLEFITDGDKETSEGYYVELMPGKQWVQIDLEEAYTIHAVWIWHFHGQKRAYTDVIVQISDDPDFKEGVTTVFNNDFDNSYGIGKGKNNPYVESNFGKLVPVSAIKGRYVRLHSNGNTTDSGNHYIEVEVFGTK